METNQWQAREMWQCRECHLEVAQQSFQAMEIKLINKLKTVTDQENTVCYHVGRALSVVTEEYLCFTCG